MTVQYVQIRYTQNVWLNFATLTWPHVSVAVLAHPALPGAQVDYLVALTGVRFDAIT
jgi:hypothetical protein